MKKCNYYIDQNIKRRVESVKTFPFSRLQKALLAVGSFSCLGLNSGVETDVVKNDALLFI